MKQYNYIICGAGCASLTFLYEILSLQNLQQKSILLIDKKLIKENDRTWCFWEKEKNLFENLVQHSWQKLKFDATNFTKVLNIEPYTYKQIRGVDFYNYIIRFAKQFNNIFFFLLQFFVYRNIISI